MKGRQKNYLIQEPLDEELIDALYVAFKNCRQKNGRFAKEEVLQLLEQSGATVKSDKLSWIVRRENINEKKENNFSLWAPVKNASTNKAMLLGPRGGTSTAKSIYKLISKKHSLKSEQNLGIKISSTGYLNEDKSEALKVWEKEDDILNQLHRGGEVGVLFKIYNKDNPRHYDEKPCILMTIHEGIGLQELLENEALQEKYNINADDLLEIFNQTIDEVRFFHEKKIIYADLKPGNIKVDIIIDDVSKKKTLKVRCFDHDVSQRKNENGDKTDTLSGSSGYLAPELIDADSANMKKEQKDRKPLPHSIDSDIFSFATYARVLFRILENLKLSQSRFGINQELLTFIENRQDTLSKAPNARTMLIKIINELENIEPKKRPRLSKLQDKIKDIKKVLAKELGPPTEPTIINKVKDKFSSLFKKKQAKYEDYIEGTTDKSTSREDITLRFETEEDTPDKDTDDEKSMKH